MVRVGAIRTHYAYTINKTCKEITNLKNQFSISIQLRILTKDFDVTSK